MRDEVAQLKKFLNPIDHCEGVTTKGASCRNRCVPGTKFCKKHTVVLKKPLPVPDQEFENKLTSMKQSNFDWANSDIDDDCLPELGEEFVN